MLPLISIITVSYNAVETIEQTILSVISQIYPRIEYIVIDGASKDTTIDVIRKYSNKITYWISEPDKGIYDAMNKGITMVTGDWILFMNCGDSFVDANVVSSFFLNKEWNTDVIYGNTILKLSSAKFLVKPSELKSIKYWIPFCHQSVFCRTSILKKIKFDLKYLYLSDYDFFYKLYNLNYSFAYLNIAVSSYSPEGGNSALHGFCCFKESLKISGRNRSLFYPIRLLLVYIKFFIVDIIPTKLLLKIRIKLYFKKPLFTRV